MEVDPNHGAIALKRPRAEWLTAALVAAAIFLVYLLVAASSTVWDRDEARYCRGATEMALSGNYLYPTLNGKAWLDKPPLIYWLMSTAIRFAGTAEIVCRFFTVLGAALACFLTYVIGRQLFSHRTGLWAMLILAATPQMILNGTAASTDAVLLALLTAVFAILARALVTGLRAWHLAGLALLFGGVMLAKGPVVALPLLSALALGWFYRRQMPASRWSLLGILGAAAAGFILFLAWAVPVNRATQGEFFEVFVARHVLHRMAQPMESHGGNLFVYLPYYFIVVLLFFFPWTLYLPGAWSALWRERLGGRRGKVFLLSWAVPTFVLMSLTATKLPHYILPIWPALALLVGAALDAAASGEPDARAEMWFKRGLWCWLPVAAAAGVAAIVAPWFFPAPVLRVPGLALGTCGLLMTARVAYEHITGTAVRSAKIALAGFVVMLAMTAVLLVPAFEHLKVSRPVAEIVRRSARENVPVAMCGYEEPSLLFYLAPRLVESVSGAAALTRWARDPRPGVLVILREDYDRARTIAAFPLLAELGRVEGLNYSKGLWVEVLVLKRQ